ncbi:putative secreted protein with PEP-CTERM sorting signal [Sphaerotilus mobilis]|uniref:Putative secreted protein with PEP-CTERM sorting signal n=1 Tax=Sphaerotilus mobilis TaxID=47994 RepID=A0A4Q7LT96_9BURK|nr:PEP-CTERM sorting domain-containing protein [Sphaerotilus mobilis]RZS58185.1 putative secreted protein with PEP-CTERM sorting signal [Sphaerotilus mobilis]
MFKKLILAAAFAVGSFGAHAAPVDSNFYSDIDGNSTVNLPIGSFIAAAALSDALVSFSLFTVPGLSSVSPTLSISLTPSGPGQLLGMGSSGVPATLTFFGFPVLGNLTNFSASFTGLTAGTYSVRLLDSNNLTNNPVASTNFSATVTAVPEPETYAMLLAGLGVVGALSRRRKALQA